MNFKWRMYYLTPSRIPNEKAEGLAILKNIDHLKSEKKDVVLLSPKRKNIFNISDIEDFFILKNKFSVKKIFSISLLHLTKQPKLQYLFFQLMTNIFIFFSLIHIKNDQTSKKKFIFVRDINSLKCSLKFQFICNIPIFFEFHQLPNTKNSNNELKLLNKCTAIITISDYQKKHLEKIGINKKSIHVLRSGYDPNDFLLEQKNIDIRKILKIKNNEFIIMYTGSLESWKSVDFIINSAKYVKKNILYVFVGGTKKQIENLKKSTNEKIKFLEYIPHNKISQYLEQADLLVHYTNPNAPQSLMSFSPIKIFEYMASGKPILAPNLPWINEIIQNNQNGLLYDPFSSEDLAQKIDFIFGNPNLINKLGTRAKIDSKKYSYKTRINKLIKIIDSII